MISKQLKRKKDALTQSNAPQTIQDSMRLDPTRFDTEMN